MDDIEGKYYCDLESANRPVQFIEGYITHTKAEWARKPFILEPWQKDYLRELFGTKRTEDGFRKYTNAWLEIPRKNGKSMLIAAIGLYLMVGEDPVEPGADIYSAAADKEQANLIKSFADAMIEQNPVLSDRLTVMQKAIYYKRYNSTFKSLSRESKTKHGLNSYANLIDEVHAHPNSELIDVLTSGTSARNQPLNIYITTAGIKKKGDVGWEKHEYARKVRDGIRKDPNWFVRIYAADEDCDPFDESVWYEANPNLGVGKKLSYMREKATQAKNQPTYLNTFKQLDLNIWTGSNQAFITPEIWKSCDLGKRSLEDFRDKKCIIGMDLAARTDLTSMALTFREDGEYTTFLTQYLPEESVNGRSNADLIRQFIDSGHILTTPGATTDYRFLESAIDNWHRMFEVLEVAYDPWNATQIMTNLSDNGANMVEVRQGPVTMSPYTKEFEKLIIDKRFNHQGNECLEWQCSNMIVKRDHNDNIMPNKKESSEKIDGMVATIISCGRWIYGFPEEENDAKIRII